MLAIGEGIKSARRKGQAEQAEKWSASGEGVKQAEKGSGTFLDTGTEKGAGTFLDSGLEGAKWMLQSQRLGGLSMTGPARPVKLC